MNLFKRKAVDDRALAAFRELIALTSRTTEHISTSSRELLKATQRTTDADVLESLVKASQSQATAQADLRATVDRVFRSIGVKL